MSGIGLELDGAIARIVIYRPALKNALDPTAWSALRDVLDHARASSARVVVVEGRGGAFCAGGDLTTIEERLALPFETRRAALVRDAGAIRALVDMGRPTIALVDGAAMGAGLALALACDIRIATTRARFSAAFRKVGLAGDFGISWLLPRAVGRGRALDLLYTGDVLDAETAMRVGLVERIAGHDVANAYVAAIATGPASLSLLRGAVDAAAGVDLANAIEREAIAQATASRTSDAVEGARAFLEKRAPVFTGK